MPYKRDVILKIDGSQEGDSEIIRAFYLHVGVRGAMEELVALIADNRARIEMAWKAIAKRLNVERGELGHLYFDCLTAEAYREEWVEPVADTSKETES